MPVAATPSAPYAFGFNNDQETHDQMKLILATGQNDLKVVREMLQAGADPNIVGLYMIADTPGQAWGSGASGAFAAGGIQPQSTPVTITPLVLASLRGHTEMAALLLGAGADPAWSNEVGMTPLLVATCQGHRETVRLLLAAGAPVDCVSKETGFAPLIAATLDDNPDMVRQLLGAGARADVKCTYENLGATTPLIMAARYGYLQVARLLIQAGANVNAACQTKQNPLFGACINNHIEVVRLLIEAGADLEQRVSKDGEATILLMVCGLGNIPIIKLLLQSGANVNFRCSGGSSSLNQAMLTHQMDVLQLLLEHGADPDVKCTVQTLLYRAVQREMVDAIRLLMQHGADSSLTSLTSQGGPETPLVSACLSGIEPMIRALLAGGADPNDWVRIGDQCTSLLLAMLVMRDRTRVARLLLEYGADPDLKTPNGIPALALLPAQTRAKADKELKLQQAALRKAGTQIRTPVRPHRAAGSAGAAAAVAAAGTAATASSTHASGEKKGTGGGSGQQSRVAGVSRGGSSTLQPAPAAAEPASPLAAIAAVRRLTASSGSPKPGATAAAACAACGATSAPGGGKLRACACLAARYCGEPCQRQHWKVHKAACAVKKDKA